MRRTGGFPPARMTKAANRTAFAMLMAGCTDERLVAFDSASLSRSYGLPCDEIRRAITMETTKRKAAQNV